MKLKVALGSLLIATTSTCFAFTSAEQFLNHLETSADGFDRVYIQGVANGLMWSNVNLRASGQRPLYCQPESMSLNNDNLIEIIKKTAAKSSGEKANPVEMVLMRGLIDTFPCKK